jgi:small multidrug resistance pump
LSLYNFRASPLFLRWTARFGVYTASMNWLYLFIAVVSEVVGTSALKASQGFTRLIPSLIVLAGYAVAFYCLSLTLRTIPVGVAYAIWSGVGIVLVSIAGLILYRQTLDLPAIAGIVLIVAGVLVLCLFSKSQAH